VSITAKPSGSTKKKGRRPTIYNIVLAHGSLELRALEHRSVVFKSYPPHVFDEIPVEKAQDKAIDYGPYLKDKEENQRGRNIEKKEPGIFLLF
jgi:hypothetical protein